MSRPTPHRRSKDRPPTKRINRDRNADRNLDQSSDPVTESVRPLRPGRGGVRKGAGRPVGSVLYKARDFLCRAKNWRTVKDAPVEVIDLADFALQVITDIAAGRVRSQIASTQLRASCYIRSECCEPIPTAANVSLNGGVSLVSILSSVAAQINEKEPGAIKALPPATPEELSNLASTIGYPGSADHIAAVLAKDATEAEVEDAPTESEDLPPPPNFAKGLIPPFAPGSRVRDDAPTPARGRLITPDNVDDEE